MKTPNTMTAPSRAGGWRQRRRGPVRASRTTAARVFCLLVAATSITLGASVSGAEPIVVPALAASRPVGKPASQQRGAVAGRVLDRDGVPLPGATVRLIGPLPELEEQRATTDIQGRYEILGAEPGEYRVEAELDGFEMVVPGTAIVRVGERAPVEITLQVALRAETVRVTAERETAPQIVERDSTAGQSTVSNRTLQRLPLPAEQALDSLPLIPGAVRGPDGLISIGGTLPSDSILLLNGLDLTDTVTGNYRLRLPLEAVERVDVYSGVYPAALGQLLGGVVDVGTAAGGDEWKFEFNNFLPRPQFHEGKLIGVEAASPRLRVSGPLAQGRLYLSQAAAYRLNRVDVNDVPRADVRDDINIEGWESLTQLDWLAAEDQQLRLTLLTFPQDEEFIGLDGLTPLEATSMNERDATAVTASHRWLVDDVSFVDSAVQFDSIGFETRPLGQLPYLVTPDRFDGNYFHHEARDTSHWQVKSAYNRMIEDANGSHLVSIGADVQHASTRGRYENQSIRVLSSGDRLLQRIDFVDRGVIDADNTEWALFVQDRWETSRRFRLDLGLRVSGDDITDDVRVAPRTGFSWDVRGNSRTLVKGAAGLLYRRVLLGEAAWDQGPARLETVFDDDGGSHSLELTPGLATDLSPPRSQLFTLEVDHRLTGNLIVRVKYAQRETRDQLIVDRLDADGVAPLADPLAGLPESTGVLLLSNSGSASSKELEITAGYGLPRNGMLFISYVRSSSEGDLNDFNTIAGERPAAIIRPNRRARLPFDAPNRLLVWGTIALPWGLIVAPVVEWHDGFPYSVLDENQAYVGTPNGARLPTFFSSDVQVTKDFGFRNRIVRLGVKLFNVDNRFNPRDVIANAASPRFGELLNSVSFQLRGKLAVLF